MLLGVSTALVEVGLVNSNGGNPKVMTLENDCTNVGKFLNCIVGIPVDLQTRLFKYFTDTLSANVIQAKKSGIYTAKTLGLHCLPGARFMELYTFIIQTATATEKLTIKLRSIEVDRGMSWKQALNPWSLMKGDKSTGGFYLSKTVNENLSFYFFPTSFLIFVGLFQTSNDKRSAMLAVQSDLVDGHGEGGEKLYTITRPNTGLQPRQGSLAEIEEMYEIVTPMEVKQFWNNHYDASKTDCLHKYWFVNSF